MLSLPPFLVTDHQRMYTLSFWAKTDANPKPRPHVAFQDEAREGVDRSASRTALGSACGQWPSEM